MTLRPVLVLAWALVTGLAGGWLILAPWAQSEQGGGDWTTVTKTEVSTGAGLLALAVLGLVVVVAQVAAAFREAGATAPARPARRADADPASAGEMDRALIALAQALAQDLDAQGTGGRRAGEPSTPPRWGTGRES